MDRMRREMDRIFSDSLAELHPSPEQSGFFDEFNFGSSVDLKEQDSNYVVTAYLPQREMQNVSTTVDGQTLKIEARAESTSGRRDDPATPAISGKARYLQILSLPGPVQADKMKVERKDSVLTVTLPKA
jgi:HSP20 family molecular chaperone IbpA